jgi:hypothetical protein
MAVQVRWHNPEKTILFVHYSEDFIWEEYDAAFDQAKIIMEALDYPVYVIHYSDTGFRRLPTGTALSHLKRASDLRPKNMALSLIIAEHNVVRNFIDMLLQVLPANQWRQPNIFVQSIEEALAKIIETPAG